MRRIPLSLVYRIQIRALANSAKPKRPNSRFGPTVSLDHFLQRSRALSLWREILRSTAKIPDEKVKRETREMVRAEFERERGVSDITQIRYLISNGKTQWQSMERYIHGL